MTNNPAGANWSSLSLTLFPPSRPGRRKLLQYIATNVRPRLFAAILHPSPAHRPQFLSAIEVHLDFSLQLPHGSFRHSFLVSEISSGMPKKRHQSLFSKPQSTAPASLGASASASTSGREYLPSHPPQLPPPPTASPNVTFPTYRSSPFPSPYTISAVSTQKADTKATGNRKPTQGR